jgi:hypothetical protein
MPVRFTSVLASYFPHQLVASVLAPYHGQPVIIGELRAGWNVGLSDNDDLIVVRTFTRDAAAPVAAAVAASFIRTAQSP